MDNEDHRPFVVVKFLSIDNDEDEYYEVALSKWLQDLDENMIGSILWPGDDSTAGTLVRTQVNAQSNWSIHTVEVKRYYDTYFHARKGLAGIIEYASAYETDTEKEMGRGKRKKKMKPIASSDESDNDQHLENQFKKKKPSIPSPPAIHVPEASTSVDKTSSHKYKRYVIEDSSNIKESKVARHLDEPRVPLIRVRTPSTINKGEVSGSKTKHNPRYERSPLSSKEKLDPPIRNSSNFVSADFHERFIRLEEKLEDISSKLDVIIMNQENLNRSLLPEKSVINRPSNLPFLPLSDIKSLEEFEKFLSKDVNLSAACYYLKSLPLGNNEKTATSKLMTQLFK